MCLKFYQLRLKKLLFTIQNKKLRKIFFRHFVLAGLEHIGVFKLVRPVTIVDIGANRGQFTLIANEFTDAKIYAFEPLIEPSIIFNKIFKSSSNVKFFNVAIGDMPGKTCIYISGKDDSSSLLPITELQSLIFPGTGEVNQAVVDMGLLENYIKSHEIKTPSLLKIDVQGFEGSVLKGSEKLLQFFDYIYCECSFLEFYKGQMLAPKVIEWLFSRGFELHAIFNSMSGKDGAIMQADFLFKKLGHENINIRN